MDGVPIHLSGGSLPSVYVLEQMHFHWSAEHTVDGVRDPLELHLVHYNNQYANFSEATQHENGIVVVAVLFEVGIILITFLYISYIYNFFKYIIDINCYILL